MTAPVERPLIEEQSGFVRTALRTLRIDLGIAAFGLLANTIAGSELVPRVLRIPLLRAAGIRVGRAHVWPGVVFGHRKIRIGAMAVINRGCFLDSYGGIDIGDQVQLGFQVSLLTATHEIGPAERRCGYGYSEPITIGRGSWIGARATVLAGVTIGAGCVIAAGAVVTEDCEPNGVYAGVPARRVRDLD